MKRAVLTLTIYPNEDDDQTYSIMDWFSSTQLTKMEGEGIYPADLQDFSNFIQTLKIRYPKRVRIIQ